MLTVRLSEEGETRLVNLVTKTGHTKTSLAREAILKYFDDLESFYLAEEHLNEANVSLIKPIISTK